MIEPLRTTASLSNQHGTVRASVTTSVRKVTKPPGDIGPGLAAERAKQLNEPVAHAVAGHGVPLTHRVERVNRPALWAYLLSFSLGGRF